MAQTVKLEIVTPERNVVSEPVQIVMAPGTLGEFGVLEGHTPFLTSLQVGKVRYRDKNGNERVVFVSGGFAEALPDRVTILADSAERRKEIDFDRAKAAMSRAEERLAAANKDNIDIARARAALNRALTRIKIAETR